jgi:hypothetical protein
MAGREYVEGPLRSGGVSPWVEIVAWLLAFAVLFAAQCLPERAAATARAAPPEAAATVTAR